MTAPKTRKDVCQERNILAAENARLEASVAAWEKHGRKMTDLCSDNAALRAQVAEMEQRQCDLVSERDEAHAQVAELAGALRDAADGLEGAADTFEHCSRPNAEMQARHEATRARAALARVTA